MAKGSRNGLAKGKKGDSVYYRISGSNNKEQQGERQYVATIKNPKTMAQAAQRVKMTPAVNFYRAFQEEILDHSFQGEKYGARCHAAFMKAALKMSVGFPFVPMGREAVAPGGYLMSRGAIPSLIYDWDDSGNLICEALSVDNSLNKFGEWSQSVIDATHFLQNGDQITFGFVMGNEDGNEFPFVCRIVLDTTDETNEVGNVLAEAGIRFNQDGIVTPENMENFDIEGAVIIVSRPNISQTTGTVTWQRSTEAMKPNYMLSYMRQRFFSQDAYDAAMNSYLAASKNNLTSDWYLNQGKAAAKVQSIPDAPIEMPFALGVTPQSHNDDSWVYGKFFATMRDTKGKVYLIADAGANDNVDIYGYDNQGNTDVISNNLYLITQPSTKSAEDAGWLAVKAQYDGVLTTAEAEALAAANGVAVTFTTGA